ncbi:MAG: hypothetical protein AAFV49_12915 [Pseudomonadota bacterium]
MNDSICSIAVSDIKALTEHLPYWPHNDVGGSGRNRFTGVGMASTLLRSRGRQALTGCFSFCSAD